MKKSFFLGFAILAFLALAASPSLAGDEAKIRPLFESQEQSLSDLKTLRTKAACTGMGGVWEGNVCRLRMDPEQVCLKLNGRWTGNRCEFVGRCLTVRP